MHSVMKKELNKLNKRQIEPDQFKVDEYEFNKHLLAETEQLRTEHKVSQILA